MSSDVRRKRPASHAKHQNPSGPRHSVGKKAKGTTSSSSSATTQAPRGKHKHKSYISPRWLWRSNAPRAQHGWQVAAKAAANSPGKGTPLQRTYSLLSQLYRRNKNQFRGQKWWRWVGLLMRNVGRLVRIEIEMAGEMGGKEKGRGTSEMGGEGGSEGVRRRLEREAELSERRRGLQLFVRDVLLGKCYLAYSTVVQDAQFAPLGVVLLGMLADVAAEVGLPKVEVEKLVGVSRRQTGVDRGEVVAREYTSLKKPRPGDDFGEVVERSVLAARHEEDEVVDHDQMQGGGITTRPAMPSSSTNREQGKKKSKKSAIDDLFAGLV